LEGTVVSKPILLGTFIPLPVMCLRGALFASIQKSKLTALPPLLILSLVALLEDSVRIQLQLALVTILGLALAGVPAVAATPNPASAPLGVIVQADRSTSGVDLAYNGSTVYDGDRLETDDRVSLRARLGGPELFLRPSTTAQVHGLANGFAADLIRGTVVASSAEGQTFQLVANGATIRPANSQPTVAQVTFVNPEELVLTSTRGVLLVSMGDEVRTVEAGKSYRMEIETENQGPQGSGRGPYHPARNRFLLFLIIGVAAGTGIGVWRALISPDQM
jgi:hypothetical protein